MCASKAWGLNGLKAGAIALLLLFFTAAYISSLFEGSFSFEYPVVPRFSPFRRRANDRVPYNSHCAISIHNLGTPSTGRAGCDDSSLSHHNTDRYRVMRYIARDSKDAAKRSIPEIEFSRARNWPGAILKFGGSFPDADIVLIDDSQFFDAYVCVAGDREAALGVLSERATRISAVLHLLAPGQVGVVAFTPLMQNVRGESGVHVAHHSRLVRLAVESSDVSVPIMAGRHMHMSRSFVLVPYAASVIDVAPLSAEIGMDEEGEAPLLFFMGACSADALRSPGMRMRWHLFSNRSAAITRWSDAEAGSGTSGGVDGYGGPACISDSWSAAEAMPRRRFLSLLSRARFCPILAGDEPSVSRLSEVLLATLGGGLCVPVVMGPPWPALPLLWAVDYQAIAVFVEMTAPGAWLTPTDAATAALSTTAAAASSTWNPEPRLNALLRELGNAGQLLRASSLADALTLLRGVKQSELRRRRAAAAAAARDFFLWAPGAASAFGDASTGVPTGLSGVPAPTRGGAGILAAVCEQTAAARAQDRRKGSATFTGRTTKGPAA